MKSLTTRSRSIFLKPAIKAARSGNGRSVSSMFSRLALSLSRNSWITTSRGTPSSVSSSATTTPVRSRPERQ